MMPGIVLALFGMPPTSVRGKPHSKTRGGTVHDTRVVLRKSFYPGERREPALEVARYAELIGYKVNIHPNSFIIRPKKVLCGNEHYLPTELTRFGFVPRITLYEEREQNWAQVVCNPDGNTFQPLRPMFSTKPNPDGIAYAFAKNWAIGRAVTSPQGLVILEKLQAHVYSDKVVIEHTTLFSLPSPSRAVPWAADRVMTRAWIKAKCAGCMHLHYGLN